MRPNGEALWSRQLRRHLKQLHGGNTIMMICIMVILLCIFSA